ncbi:ATP-dependent nuclease [Streptomyces sp. XY511]|uniref:ATP-dependent nuclease n=1 Tax=Streptomyces sp. XY511 TaxID=1519480 RepID=UPI00099DEA73|nr:ATP-binding protein [Streptomyces sp. XY511]
MGEISGFEIQGYKSFYSDPQRISPLGKMTVIAGPNNSGKSNIFRFAEKFLSPLSENPQRVPELEPLDIPILPEGRDVPPFRFGISVDTQSPHDYLTSIFGSIEQRLGPATVTALEDFVGHPTFYDRTNGSLWFQFERDPRNEILAFSNAWVDTLAEELSHHAKHLNAATQTLVSRSSDLKSNIRTLLAQFSQTISHPKVITIPAFREIVPDGSPTPDLTRLDGRGLPGFLHALHSPSAERHREDSRKFQRINNFLKNVLGNEEAQITIPYNSKTVHVSVGDRVLPIESLGAGVSQVVMLAAVSTWHSGTLICIEEPEVHLHPILLRKLARYLVEETDNRYLLSTHSTSLMDNPEVSVIDISHSYEEGTKARTAVTENSRARISQSLGYRASDILQSNCIIWVEGPSDRIYINHWISTVDQSLIEGIHYTVMFYGGKLLSHLSGAEWLAPDAAVEDFILLLKINRRMAIVIDSDLKSADDELRQTKVRIMNEFTKVDCLSWVTEGREIENYVPADKFREAATAVHASADPVTPSDRYSDMFAGVKRTKDGVVGVSTPDKVKIAMGLTRDSDSVWEIFDLRARVDALVDFVRESNHL